MSSFMGIKDLQKKERVGEGVVGAVLSLCRRLQWSLAMLLGVAALSGNSVDVAAEQGAGLFPVGPSGLIWEASVAADATGPIVDGAVEKLLTAYEEWGDVVLRPMVLQRVGLKVNTRSGAGLATPKPVVRAVVAALERRGFERDMIMIVDYSERDLRSAGFLPPLSAGARTFEGVPVIALERGDYFDEEWYYDSPLPPQREAGSFGFRALRPSWEGDRIDRSRRSYLAVPLLLGVDFWINLPVFTDDPAVGVDGALASATLWNISNAQRFLANRSTAAAAIAEVAAIPEQRERMILTLASLWRFQYIGGPGFRSLYTRSEPRLWLSGDPVAIDRLMLERMNFVRRLEGFPEIAPLPSQFPFANSLGLGEYELSRIQTVILP